MSPEDFCTVVPEGWHFSVLYAETFSVSFQGNKVSRKEWKFFACTNTAKGQKSREVSLTSYTSLEDLFELAKRIEWEVKKNEVSIRDE